MPPQREIFRQTASAAPEPGAPRSAAVSSIATGTGDFARTARIACEPVDRLLAQLDADRRERAQVRERLVGRRPGAVGVDPDRHLVARRGAHRRQPARVVADPDLDLQAAEARRGGSRGGLGRARAVRRRRSSR